ncbi:MAG: hypothetical protein WAN36_01750 [Calditrichia bacterium]
MENNIFKEKTPAEEPALLLKSWKAWYSAVLLLLLGEIILFWALTIIYKP